GFSGGTITSFQNFQTLIGSNGNDTFDFSAAGSISEINGNTNGLVIGEVNEISGELASTWTIDAINNGSVIGTESSTAYVGTFSNINSLQGGDAVVDHFVVNGDFSGSMDGGTG